jgi:perosamine synthetase
MFRLVAPSGTPIKAKHIFNGLYLQNRDKVLMQFQEKLQEYLQVHHCFLVSSGRAALTLILKTLAELRPDKTEVIIPGYTCFSVPSAVVKAGLKIVPADISMNHLGLDADKLEPLINKNTLAIISVHLLGIPSNMSEYKQLAKKHRVWLIDDAAQAMGATWNNKMLGTLGDIGFYSLGRGKNMTTGAGGIIVTDFEEIAIPLQQQIQNLPDNNIINDLDILLKMVGISCFLPPRRYWFAAKLPMLELGKSEFSTRFRLARYPPSAAGIGLALLPELTQINAVRKKNAAWLNVSLSHLHTNRIQTISPSLEGEPVYLRYPLFFVDSNDRKKIFSRMVQSGIGASPLYPTAITQIEGISRYFGPGQYSVPVAQQVADTILTLPTHPYVTEKDLDKMTQILFQRQE